MYVCTYGRLPHYNVQGVTCETGVPGSTRRYTPHIYIYAVFLFLHTPHSLLVRCLVTTKKKKRASLFGQSSGVKVKGFGKRSRNGQVVATALVPPPASVWLELLVFVTVAATPRWVRPFLGVTRANRS